MMKGWLFYIVFIFGCFQSAAEVYDLFEENGKIGLRNEQGKVVIPPKYEALGWSDGSISVVNQVTGYRSNGLWGVIDLNDQHITEASFFGLIPGEGDVLVAVKRSALSFRLITGCIDTSGKEVIPFLYDSITVNNFRAIVSVKSESQYRYGLIDVDNKTLIPVEFKAIERIGMMRYSVKNQQGKCALFSDNGKQLTAFVFDDIDPFKKDYAVVVQNGKQGIINREGQVRKEPAYKTILLGTDSITAKAKPFDEWVVLDGQNKVLQKVEADSIVALNNNLFKLSKGETTLLVNSQFTPVITAKFSSLGQFINNKSIFCQEDKMGIISGTGAVLIEGKYDKLIAEKNYVIAVNRDQWSLLDSTGNVKTTKNYDYIGNFNGVTFPVRNRGHYGAVDRDGKEVVSCVYDTIEQILNELLVVKFHKAYGIIDMDENWVVAPQTYPLSLVSDDRYLVKQRSTVFLKSFDGSIIYFTENRIEPKADHLIEYISTGGTWKIDLDGRIVSRQMPPADPYEKILPESEGLRGIKKDGRYGFIDDQGRLRIANRYEDIKPFADRLAAIKLLNKWGFLDHDERITIQPVYDEVTSFRNGMAIVQQKGLYGLVDKKGTLVLPARYQSVTLLSTKRFLLMSEGKYGLADTNGRLIAVPKFDYLADLNNGYLIVARDGKFGLITTENISTIPLMYDYVSYDSFNGRYFALRKTAWEEISL